MSNEATSLVSYEHSSHEYCYETTSTIQTIISAIQDTTTTHGQQCALVTITLQFALEDVKTPRRRHLTAHSTHYYLDTLRCLVRKADKVYLLDSTFYFVLLGADREGGRIVESRLWDALLWCVHNVNQREILRPRTMTIGHSAYSALEYDAHANITIANEPSYSFDTQPETDTSPVDSQQDDAVVMVDTDVISREGELTALARKLGMPYLSLLPRKKREQVQRLVTLKLAHELQCYPLGRERGTLTVALSNPQDSTILARLHKETGLRIFPVLAHPQELQTALSLLV
ncbi:MAG: hypothetical protein NVS9B9_10860 [Ktedonobacteraceae bacterium]